MKKTPAEPQPVALFDDVAPSGPLTHAETVSAPADDSLAKILTDLRNGHARGACQPGMPIVFGIGPAPAELMIIGEGPGLDDVPSEQPFQGQAGGLLTRMLAAINVAWGECYICNVIKCVPPGERNFAAAEIEDCRVFLLRQIMVVNPRVIVAFGALAAQTLLREKKTISNLRGNVYKLRLNEREINVVPTFNPAYLLRVAEKKREAWEDLKLVRELLLS